MIQLLIALAIVALLAFTLLGGDKSAEEQQPAAVYRQHVEMARGLEQSMQQAADQRMQEMDRQTTGD